MEAAHLRLLCYYSMPNIKTTNVNLPKRAFLLLGHGSVKYEGLKPLNILDIHIPCVLIKAA
jgi:hypothetical protein